MPRSSKLCAARLGRAERATEALELRKAGLTFKQIGARMGFTEQRAHKLVTEELARLNARRAEDAAVTRIEVERLDALLAAVWPKALKGDLACIDRVLSIMARRARLLGIDAERPAGGVTMQNISVAVEMTDHERAEAIRAILARAGPAGGALTQAAGQQAGLAALGGGGAGQDTDGPAGAARPLLGEPRVPDDGGGDGAGCLADGVSPLDF
jgi:hypothetical protein